jgi:hypothetical protein
MNKNSKKNRQNWKEKIGNKDKGPKLQHQPEKKSVIE